MAGRVFNAHNSSQRSQVHPQNTQEKSTEESKTHKQRPTHTQYKHWNKHKNRGRKLASCGDDAGDVVDDVDDDANIIMGVTLITMTGSMKISIMMVVVVMLMLVTCVMVVVLLVQMIMFYCWWLLCWWTRWWWWWWRWWSDDSDEYVGEYDNEWIGDGVDDLIVEYRPFEFYQLALQCFLKCVCAKLQLEG